LLLFSDRRYNGEYLLRGENVHDEQQNHLVFTVKYHRQRATNQWKATTNEEPAIETLDVEGVLGLAIGQWQARPEADEDDATIYLSVKFDPRFFDLSPELQEGRIAMTEKANQIADQEFLKRYPSAKVEHVRGEP
jgi:hypothetical protein